MGWQDRNYGPNSINYGDRPFSNPILNIFFGAIPLGRWFGIRVLVHASLLWYIAFQMLQARAIGWMDVGISSVLLFAMVLLHEFGHCIGARLMGGHAEQIMLWPLGGLAFSSTERTPWARFVTVAGGPLVNVILVVVLGGVLMALTGELPPLNPLAPFVTGVLHDYFNSHPNATHIYDFIGGRWLMWAIMTNWSLLIFNLVPVYPLDGGSLVQVALWKPLGYKRSMIISCNAGMAAAVLFAVWGLAYGTTFTLFLAVFGFITCLQQKRAAEMTEENPYDLSAAWDEPATGRSKRKIDKRNTSKVRKQVKQERDEQEKIDAILIKVKEQGLHSLTWFEKRTLKKATERQRQRDMARRS